MQDDVKVVARKFVVGLQQVAADMQSQSNIETAGFGSSLGHYSDRINGYAAELAAAIGIAKEASADMLAARQLGAMVFDRFIRENGPHTHCRLRYSDDQHPTLTMPASEAGAEIRDGKQDDCDVVQDMLAAIIVGRQLADDEANKARQEEMLQAPRDASEPKRLTVIIGGPVSLENRLLARRLTEILPLCVRQPYSVKGANLDPQIIEMREGRPFDVRADAFIHGKG